MKALVKGISARAAMAAVALVALASFLGDGLIWGN
jgi:hypothetical protein